MNIMGKKFIFLGISGLLVVGSIFAFALWGLKWGIDFTGGSLMEVEFLSARPAPGDIQRALGRTGVDRVVVQPAGERDVLLRFRPVDEETHQRMLGTLSALAPQKSSAVQSAVVERRFDTVGPTIGIELKQRAFWALALAIGAIISYIAWAFRKVSRPVASWKYGVAAFVALIHDVAIPTGAFALLGYTMGVEADPLFMTALLTVLGFSVHDTIVVFDRIRENLGRLKAPEPFECTVNRSVNETLVRSLMTSLTVLLVLLAVFFLGGASTKYFSVALIIGIVFGTYSSIFVASPILVIWENWTRKK
ncbi:MAG: protein translocase subunit SecF [Candidatus Sungbacteria bacterium]|uniref:Protein-export membrane protein SecF n=1 Tax=Candidatus Sungiibacteriota bacterium TaxID=2750080 RepID=A0A932VPT0_9BACT|nr:protein translocase subunit SecF [Candidatus Sungbacteria bacterium]